MRHNWQRDNKAKDEDEVLEHGRLVKRDFIHRVIGLGVQKRLAGVGLQLAEIKVVEVAFLEINQQNHHG